MHNINFDEIIDRRSTNSLKWTLDFDGNPLRDNQIPMWVADMDFKSAKEIIDALREAVDFGIFGYFTYDGYPEVVVNWCKERYSLDIKREDVCFTQGLVQGFSLAIAALTHPGESVLLLTPTYYPMFGGIKSQGCHIVSSDLNYDEETGYFSIDYEDVERKAKDPNVTVALIGNPHNPTGRLYTIEELTRLADILIRNNVKMICDDIHCDIIVDPSKKYVPLLSINKYRDHIVYMNAPSKTFNLAGIKVSNVIIPNEDIRRAFILQMDKVRVSVSILSLAACKAAYSKCSYWVDAMKDYVWNNYLYIKDYMENGNLKGYIKPVPLEGSYLMFADNRNLMQKFNLGEDALKKFYTDTCNLSLDDGGAFGRSGVGFMRFNLATQRYFVEIAMKNLSEGLETLKK